MNHKMTMADEMEQARHDFELWGREEQMLVVNHTPHVVTIGEMVIEPCGNVARCVEISAPAGSFAGVELITRQYGHVEGLPEPLPNVMYIVSALVRMALPERNDLASPGDLVRDENGKITGCKNLVVNKREEE